MKINKGDVIITPRFTNSILMNLGNYRNALKADKNGECFADKIARVIATEEFTYGLNYDIYVGLEAMQTDLSKKYKYKIFNLIFTKGSA